MKKILHISNWYPNKWNDLEGIFVKEQFQVFSEVTEGHMLNVQVREGKAWCRYEHVVYSDKEEGYYLFTRVKSQKIIEVLTTLLLLWALCKSQYKKYDLLHFHIAYPLLTYYSWWKRVIKLPILISEHWSAYHFNFYIPWSTKKLDRVKGIFRQRIPLITVSHALLEDIQTFSGVKDFPSAVIPNVIDQKYFYHKEQVPNEVPVFFSVNNWRKIKNPFPMLEGFAKVHHKGMDFRLILGGYGEETENMKAFVNKEGFASKVQFPGKMVKEQIADTLARSDVYLFSSDYETFSVVCAQALCCGVPIMGPRLSAIEEYAPADAYFALENNAPEQWEKQIEIFMQERGSCHREKIAKQANAILSNTYIAKQYREIFDVWFR